MPMICQSTCRSDWYLQTTQLQLHSLYYNLPAALQFYKTKQFSQSSKSSSDSVLLGPKTWEFWARVQDNTPFELEN